MGRFKPDGSKGKFKLDREVLGRRMKRLTGATTPEEHQKRKDYIEQLEKLALRGDQRSLETLEAIFARTLSVAEVYEGATSHAVASIQESSTAHLSLWSRVEEWKLVCGDSSEATRSSYLEKIKRLDRMTGLPASARVSDLLKVNWKARAKLWTQADNTWNGTRQALSTFLTWHFGSKGNQTRCTIMEACPKFSSETEPAAEITPDEFFLVLAHVEPIYRAVYLALVLTGLRIGELIRLTSEHLVPTSCGIKLIKRNRQRTTKTLTGVGNLMSIPEQFWPVIERAIPVPTRPVGVVSYKEHKRMATLFLRNWKRAAAAAGRPELIVHALRNAYICWNLDNGVELTRVQALARHASVEMTALYARRRQLKADSSVIGTVIGAALERSEQRLLANVG